jgi:hypothetical protein
MGQLSVRPEAKRSRSATVIWEALSTVVEFDAHPVAVTRTVKATITAKESLIRYILIGLMSARTCEKPSEVSSDFLVYLSQSA